MALKALKAAHSIVVFFFKVNKKKPESESKVLLHIEPTAPTFHTTPISFFLG